MKGKAALVQILQKQSRISILRGQGVLWMYEALRAATVEARGTTTSLVRGSANTAASFHTKGTFHLWWTRKEISNSDFPLASCRNEAKALYTVLLPTWT